MSRKTSPASSDVTASCTRNGLPGCSSRLRMPGELKRVMNQENVFTPRRSIRSKCRNFDSADGSRRSHASTASAPRMPLFMPTSTPLDVAEVAEDRGARMARVLPLEVELSGEESISPGGVDEETTGPAAFSTVLVHRDDRRVRASRKVDGRHLHAFQDLGALGGA